MFLAVTLVRWTEMFFASFLSERTQQIYCRQR